MCNKLFIICAALLALQTCSLHLSAQNLPNKQKVSIWAPTNLRIDGKADEWNGAYQALNNATEMYYTISNDDQNLYLAAYISSPTALFNKAMTGGIMLIIKYGGHEISVRYPAFPKNGMPSLARLPKGELFTGKDDDPVIVKDNAAFADKAKEIEVVGVSEVDSVISIYNQYGFKAAGRFDANQGYTYELAVPLKYLGLSAGGGSKFNYQIVLNGGKNKFTGGSTVSKYGATSITRADGTAAPQSEVDATNEAAHAAIYARFATTDFAGEYTLAKRP